MEEKPITLLHQLLNCWYRDVTFLIELISRNNVELDIEEYYNEDKFKEDIKKFISDNIFIQDIEWLSNKVNESEKIIDSLHKIKNMRRIKKLFKNFQIQAPSIVEYGDDDKVEKYFEYFEKMLSKYNKSN